MGGGTKVTIRDVAAAAKDVFGIKSEPAFRSMPERSWDVADWYASTSKTEKKLGWKASISLKDGLRATARWFRALESPERYLQVSKKHGLYKVYSARPHCRAACYKDNLAVPIMYERLKTTFEKLRVDYEIIFVND